MGCCGSAVQTIYSVPEGVAGFFGSYELFVENNKAKPAVLGMLLLDGHKKPSIGSFHHAGSFDYQIKQEVVKGLTLEVCHEGKLTKDLEDSLAKSVAALEAAGASVICGSSGSMLFFQPFVRQKTKLPVILSAMAMLPSVSCSYSADEKVAIFYAGSNVPESLLKEEYRVDLKDSHYHFERCDDLPGFKEVAAGSDDATQLESLKTGLLARAHKVLEDNPKVRAFVLENTELPRFAHALRKATFRPVFDAIKLCDFYINSHMDNPRFGLKDWDDARKGTSPAFNFGQTLSMGVGELESFAKPVLDLVKVPDLAMQVYEGSKQHAVSMWYRSHRAGVKLGVIRLDYHYPPAPGDVDHPGSYGYEVLYHMVSGLTFEMCQSGKLTPEVQDRFLKGLKELEAKGASVITGDCGFMMWLQELARKNTKLPVIMSSLATLPAITASYHRDEKIAIFTANGKSLLTMKDLIMKECGVDVKDERYIFVGCEEVPGFEAVAAGEKVDVKKVTPGIVKKAQEILSANPKVRSILMECTELPPYSDAVRHVCGVPVFDAITACDFYIACHVDSPKMKV